jgi:hypothetical protein
MSPIFHDDPDNLYKLMAIHKALMLAKWADPPLSLEVAGSPFIAEALTEIQKIIDQIEIDRGKPERANWSGGKMMTHSARWKATLRIAVPNPIPDHFRRFWLNASEEERMADVRILFSPFEPDEEQISIFMAEVTRRMQAE